MLTEKQLLDEVVEWIRYSNIKYSTPEHVAQALEDGSWRHWLVQWKKG